MRQYEIGISFRAFFLQVCKFHVHSFCFPLSAGCDAVLPAPTKVPEKAEPEEIDWSLRAKAYVTENNDIYLCSKSGEKKLFWGGTDFSNLPEKKKLLLRKKINRFKKGKIQKPGVKSKDKRKKNKRENKKGPKENGGLKEKHKKKNNKIDGKKKEFKTSPKAEKKIKKKKLKEKISQLKSAKKSVKVLKKNK